MKACPDRRRSAYDQWQQQQSPAGPPGMLSVAQPHAGPPPYTSSNSGSPRCLFRSRHDTTHPNIILRWTEHG